MTKIVIFTDLHYGEHIQDKVRQGINTHGDTDDLLVRLTAEIRDINPNVVVNLGDLVFGTSRKNKIEKYQYLLKNFFAKINSEIYHLLGNHELFVIHPEDVKNILNSSMRSSFIIDGVKHITLDIEFPENKLIQVPAATIEWLKQELQTDCRCIIYSHFPITEQIENVSYYHQDTPKRAFLANSQELRDIIKGTNCRYWISGHTHFHYETEIDGIQHVTLPSFSEDNNGKPNGCYAVLDTEGMNLDIKHII